MPLLKFWRHFDRAQCSRIAVSSVQSRLDSTKSWYVFNEERFGSAFRKYKENAFNRLFPNEIHRISFCELVDSNGTAVIPDLIGVKYQKIQRFGALDSWALWRIITPTRIKRRKQVDKRIF